jgi:hypothetical protein
MTFFSILKKRLIFGFKAILDHSFTNIIKFADVCGNMIENALEFLHIIEQEFGIHHFAQFVKSAAGNQPP